MPGYLISPIYTASEIPLTPTGNVFSTNVQDGISELDKELVYSSSAPENPSEGSLWVDSDTFETYVYNGSDWVLISGSGGGATGGGTDEVFYENDTLVTTDYTITENKNAVTAGPTGPTGPTGATGEASTVTGPTGPTGATGPQPSLSNDTPLVDGTANAGNSTTASRSNHVHPTDTTRAALESPTFTGTPAAPTAAARTNTTQLATTAFVYEEVNKVSVDTKTESYTLAVVDAGKVIEMNVASANNLTIPLNSSVAIPVGTTIDIVQYGAGQTTLVPTSGVTVRSKEGALKLTGQYSAVSLYKRGTDEWVAVGDLSA
jgi:hypothetical protein